MIDLRFKDITKILQKIIKALGGKIMMHLIRTESENHVTNISMSCFRKFWKSKDFLKKARRSWRGGSITWGWNGFGCSKQWWSDERWEHEKEKKMQDMCGFDERENETQEDRSIEKEQRSMND